MPKKKKDIVAGSKVVLRLHADKPGVEYVFRNYTVLRVLPKDSNGRVFCRLKLRPGKVNITCLELAGKQPSRKKVSMAHEFLYEIGDQVNYHATLNGSIQTDGHVVTDRLFGDVQKHDRYSVSGIATPVPGELLSLMVPKLVPLDNWDKLGIRLFGPDVSRWVFVCPFCGCKSDAKDYTDLGVDDATVPLVLGWACIGNWTDRKGCQKTLNHTKKAIGILEIDYPEDDNRLCFDFKR